MRYCKKPGHMVFRKIVGFIFLSEKMVLSQNTASRKGTGRYRKEFRKRYWKVVDNVKNHASRKGTGRYRKVFRKVFPEHFYAIAVFLPKSNSRRKKTYMAHV